MTRSDIAVLVSLGLVASCATHETTASTPTPTAAVADAGAPPPITAASATVEADASVDAADASFDAPAEGGDGSAEARAQVALPKPKGAPFRPHGRCVNTELHATRLMQQAIHGSKAASWKDFVYVMRSDDLDGDGNADEIRNGGAENITHRYFIYVMRNGCGYFVGQLNVDASIEPLDTFSHGLRDLGGLAACQPTCCEELMYTEYHFDGQRYRVAKKELRKVRDCSHLGLP